MRTQQIAESLRQGLDDCLIVSPALCLRDELCGSLARSEASKADATSNASLDVRHGWRSCHKI